MILYTVSNTVKESADLPLSEKYEDKVSIEAMVTMRREC